MGKAYIAAASMIPFGKYPDRTASDLGREAIGSLLEETGIETSAIEAVYAGRAFSSHIDGQVAVPGQVALAASGICDVPVFNIDNACAACPSALHLATQAIRAGQYEAVMVIGMDKLYATDRRRSMRALFGAMDVEKMAWMSEALDGDGKAGSIFMEHYYARIAREYLKNTGATERDLARIAVKNRKHASLNAVAQYRKPMTEEEVLASPVVAEPLRTLMCSPLTDGAAAFLVCSENAGKTFGLPLVEVAASVVRSGMPQRGTADPVLARASARAFEEASIGPEDVDLAEVHDASAVAEMIAIEEIGLAPAGEAKRLLRDGDTALGGRIPVNSSGGLLSRGHPGAATGAAQLVELVWQLQERGGDRQVEKARVGLAQSSGGLVADEAAATAITILRR
ncbi:thiolase family protein [Oceanibacterium hippocampi]|uniref:propanoyl-CoA C-acyltransferase n=1 Tax=Oceanibacterium hippocampi TaxID=745714 RepID=A0A1Y5TSA1_9PROT|nr:thiolase family protein [Oceanibacterium hippocampi]SLN71039.1 putative acetyl-CoA acyltransferase [Oceanibacterium hippocampi]